MLCSQELVNLCLIGCAVSNVFDNNLKCDELVLQGVKKQSKIGFLTLYEYGGGAKVMTFMRLDKIFFFYNNWPIILNEQVGSCYKSPKLPIFVILSEDHFTVLFAKDKINDDNHHQIELYYYDGLMNQENEIHLTIGRYCIIIRNLFIYYFFANNFHKTRKLISRHTVMRYSRW